MQVIDAWALRISTICISYNKKKALSLSEQQTRAQYDSYAGS